MTEHFQKHHGEDPNETLVRFIVEQSLGDRVCSYDDRRGTSRVDAVIHRHGGVPLEIVSDPWIPGNEQTNALAKKARDLTIPGLKVGYKVQLTSAARVNKLTWVEPTLRLLDDPATRASVPRRSAEYDSIVAWPFLAPGRVIFATGGGGGRSDYTALDVVTAAAEILARDTYADVARKLGDHGGQERHAVVIVDEDQTPVFAWLRRRRDDDLPALAELSAARAATRGHAPMDHAALSPSAHSAMVARRRLGRQGVELGRPRRSIGRLGRPCMPRRTLTPVHSIGRPMEARLSSLR